MRNEFRQAPIKGLPEHVQNKDMEVILKPYSLTILMNSTFVAD
jgi:hypothetical protein